MGDNETKWHIGWLQNIPSGWQYRIIKRDFEVKLGKMLQSYPETEFDTEEFYLRSANITWKGVNLSDVKKMWFSPLDKSSTRLTFGDLLVCEGGDVGRSCIWNDELEECYIQNALNRVRPLKNSSNHFLYYWLFLLKHQGFIDAFVSRITIAHLTAEKLERIPIILPKAKDQAWIAQYLDKTCATIDRAIGIKQQQFEKLEELRKSIIYRAVTKGLDDSVEMRDSGVEWIGEIPSHWKVERIKRRCSRIQTGVTPPTDRTDYYVEGDIPWFAPGSFSEDIQIGEPIKLVNLRSV